MNVTDREIITIFNKNKNHGLKLLFKRYYKPLCVFAFKYLDDLDLSEDIVQEIFIKIWERDIFEEQTNLSAFLFTSVKNLSISHLRKVSPCYIDCFEEDIAIEEYNSEEDILERNRILMEAIENLPEKTREVFKIVVFDNLKYKEVAEELNISVNTVKSNLARAYRLLKGSLNILIVYLM